jgi:excisionase family DNA binding protein
MFGRMPNDQTLPVPRENLLTAEVAEYWRCTEETVRRGLRARRINGFKIGRSWRVPRSEMERVARNGGL